MPDALFQSSPAPKGRCYRCLMPDLPAPSLFQSSPAPKGRCYLLVRRLVFVAGVVSILTGPEGPVLWSTPIVIMGEDCGHFT